MRCMAMGSRNYATLSSRRWRNGCARCGSHSRSAGVRSRTSSLGCLTIFSHTANTQSSMLDGARRTQPAQADLAGILHALGLALYFGKDPRLHDTRVLNPSWVTGGGYAVIRAPSVAGHDGQLAVRNMSRVLREAEEQKVIKATDYPPK